MPVTIVPRVKKPKPTRKEKWEKSRKAKPTRKEKPSGVKPSRPISGGAKKPGKGISRPKPSRPSTKPGKGISNPRSGGARKPGRTGKPRPSKDIKKSQKIHMARSSKGKHKYRKGSYIRKA